MELLEGVVEFHKRNFQEAKILLMSAKQKYDQVEFPPFFLLLF